MVTQLCTVMAGGQTVGPAGWKAGAASVDITPDYPVRLSGYGSRTTPHEGVEMRIRAKALALTWENTPPAVILTVDNCGVPATIRAEVLQRLKAAGHAIDDARFSLHSSHTHCAPALPGLLPFLFGNELSGEEQAAINRYAEDLTLRLVKVVKDALDKQEPAKLHWSSGKVSFAMNRRLKNASGYSNSPNPYGPVDHALPVLRVTTADGKLRAIYTSYACHCTTLSINKIHADWAGCAQKELQLRFPDAIAMTAIGCGADQNPYPRREMEHVERHGVELAKEAVRVINEPMKAIRGPITCASREVMLPFDTPHDRTTWEQRAQDKNKWTAQHAKHFLATLDRGEKIPAALPYMIQVWSFNDDLLTINLPGEVVVDYGLRFKKENDPARTWVNSYTNDVPCYIPSQRVWEEGGYEAAGAMVYYGRPNRFASGVEEIIAQAVKELVPTGFVQTKGKK
ncbi:neutral/alkaline non-lysosomal ceramidase N-terminal domain-containing protein [Prosthecobacter sp. SYSU 5D2]|uniref:neutral/alkaline non-lysosomal ceramidase N-terminal domain-containing protein n=1 Tax=Prosthecobacter sp. SYSU 5D2 TaxID=3134134 RepID=UPI0031FF1ED9